MAGRAASPAYGPAFGRTRRRMDRACGGSRRWAAQSDPHCGGCCPGRTLRTRAGPTGENPTCGHPHARVVAPGYWSGSVRGSACSWAISRSCSAPRALVGFIQVTPSLGVTLLAVTHRQGHQQHHEHDRDRDNDHDHTGADREHGDKGSAQILRLLPRCRNGPWRLGAANEVDDQHDDQDHHECSDTDVHAQPPFSRSQAQSW